MSDLMYAQMGLSAFSSLAGYAANREQSKLDAAVQSYNNTISALSAAQSLNVTTLNEVQAQDAAQRTDVEIQRQAIQAEGQARVAAGAAGVKGGSVDTVMRGLRSSVARAHYATSEQLRKQYTSFGQARRNTLVAKELNRDVSVIPRPSAASTLLGISKDMLSIWDTNQPAGQRIADRLARKEKE